MIEILKCLKGLFPPIRNGIFMLKNMPCALRNSKDLESQLPKTVHYRLENITYKAPQLRQQPPEKIKKYLPP